MVEHTCAMVGTVEDEGEGRPSRGRLQFDTWFSLV